MFKLELIMTQGLELNNPLNDAATLELSSSEISAQLFNTGLVAMAITGHEFLSNEKVTTILQDLELRKIIKAKLKVSQLLDEDDRPKADIRLIVTYGDGYSFESQIVTSKVNDYNLKLGDKIELIVPPKEDDSGFSLRESVMRLDGIIDTVLIRKINQAVSSQQLSELFLDLSDYS